MRYAQTTFVRRLGEEEVRQAAWQRNLSGSPLSMFRDYTYGMDVVMRYESIRNDLGEVFKRLAMPTNIDIPDINRTHERTQRDYRVVLFSILGGRGTGRVFADMKRYDYEF